MKTWLVVLYIWYDWEIFDVETMAMCDTYEEAEQYIIDKGKPKRGLSSEYYIFKKVKGETS